MGISESAERRPGGMNHTTRCPTCGGFDRVRELEKRHGRKERKRERTKRDPFMLKVRAGTHMWECSRCDKGWFTHDT